MEAISEQASREAKAFTLADDRGQRFRTLVGGRGRRIVGVIAGSDVKRECKQVHDARH